jgi:hypothetical protein
MGKGGGGAGNPLAFTGGGLMAPPPGGVTPSSPAVVPSYPNFLPSSGSEMATPESVANAYNAYAASQPKLPPPSAPAAQPDAGLGGMRDQLARLMQQYQLQRSVDQGGMVGPMEGMIAQAQGKPTPWFSMPMYRQQSGFMRGSR